MRKINKMNLLAVFVAAFLIVIIHAAMSVPAAVAQVTTVGQWDLDGNGSLETIKLTTTSASKRWDVTGSETFAIQFTTAYNASLVTPRQMDAGAGLEMIFRYQDPFNSSNRYIRIVALQNDPNKIETIGHPSSQAVAYHNLDGGAGDEILLSRATHGSFASYSFRTKTARTHVFRDTGSGFATTANFVHTFVVGKFKAGGEKELALIRFPLDTEPVQPTGYCLWYWNAGFVEMWDPENNTTRTHTLPPPHPWEFFGYAIYRFIFAYNPIAVDDSNASDDLEVKMQFSVGSGCYPEPTHTRRALIDDDARTISWSTTYP